MINKIRNWLEENRNYVPPPDPDPMEGKTAVGPVKCLYCEGRGVRRNYLDRAGSYDIFHCRECGGTGNEPLEA